MRNCKTVNAAASLTTLGAATVLYVSVIGLAPAPDPAPHEATGWVMAQQALDHLKPGGRLIVIRRDPETFAHPESVLQFASFEQAVRQAKASIGAVQSLQVDPLRPLEVPAGDFFELIRKAPPGSVIVSFLGPPILTPDQHERLPDRRPWIVAFCPGALPEQIDLRVLFSDGLLHTAVISRRNPLRPASAPRDPEAWFKCHYQIVTAADVAALYTPQPGSR